MQWYRDCCGSGVVEVKCLFSHRDSTPCNIDYQGFFLTKHSRSESVCSTSLKSAHKHYRQVQGQINLAEVGFCDFVCGPMKEYTLKEFQQTIL